MSTTQAGAPTPSESDISFGLQVIEIRCVSSDTSGVRELLTPALAGVNPKAYIAHFRRLEADAQRHYLTTLLPDELKLHFKTVGEVATVGLFLSMPEGRLEATVGGAALGEAVGPELMALQARAVELGQAIEAKTVSGMLVTSLEHAELLAPVLAVLGWQPRSLILAGDAGDEHTPPSLGWAMRGVIADVGTFYMPNEAFPWETRAAVEARLRELSVKWGAVLDVRL